MMLHPAERPIETLLEEVEASILKTTHGRIRDLAVEVIQGCYVVRGQTSSHYAKQLALQAALDLLPSKQVAAKITVN